MAIQLTTSQLRGLKGAPISVLMAMILVGQPVGAEWLEDTTGYTYKVVASALRFLSEIGYIQRNGRYHWVITGEVTQMPLMAPQPELPDPTPAEQPTSEEPLPENRVGIIPTPEPSSSSRVFNLDSSKENLLARKPPDPEKFRVDANLQELAAQGIRDPARSRLATLPGVTPEMIRAHCASCPGKLGQAIYHIEHNWPLPAGSLQPALPQPPQDLLQRP